MAIERLSTEQSREPLPPHNTEAEAAVLGGLLIDRDAIGRVATILRPQDFYRGRNSTIYEAMLALYERREPIDYLTLSDELQRTGRYDEVGGLVYLSSLFTEVPTSLHVEQYARIVEAAALRRRIIGAAGRIAALGYDETLETIKALEEAEQTLFAVTERRASRDFQKLADVLRAYWEELLLAADVDRLQRGIPTDFKDLDKLLGGLQRSDLVIVAARPSMGKALALDTPIPTPRGWMTMGSLQPGDPVFDERGQPCTVQAATEVQYGRQCYEVLFSDGQRVVADADHQWSVETRRTRRQANRATVIVTTEELARSISTGDHRLNYSIPLAGALQYPRVDLPVHPYVLGVWLGDGSANGARVTLGDEELIEHLGAGGCPTRAERTSRPEKARTYTLSDRTRGGRQSSKLTYPAACEIRGRLAGGEGSRALAELYGVSIGAIQQIGCGRTWRRPDPELSVARHLRDLGVLSNKHVPVQYLHASVEQRLALLQGLMDTDGHVDRAGYAEFCTTSPELASGVLELVTSFGMAPRLHVDRASLNGGDYGPRYRVRYLPTDYPVCRLSRKLSRQRRVSRLARARRRYVVRVSPVPSVPVRCIQVDSPSQLYLAGTGGIPTHNSAFALCLARNAAVRFGATAGIFSLEMSMAQLAQRLLFSESGVDSSRLRQATLGQVERRKLAEALGVLASAPIYLDDTPNIALSELRAKARRLHHEVGLDLLVVDYLQLIQGSGRENRVNEISEISRSLKGLARELNVPVVALSQLSRAVETRSPHIPMLSDLRESGCLTGDTLVALASGELAPIASLVGQQPTVVTLDGWRVATAQASKVWKTGHKPVFRLTTATGRVIRATANHPFRLLGGWQPLSNLRVGDRIAIPRRYPALADTDDWPSDRLILLAHLIGDGCYAPRQPLHYTSASEANRAAVEEAARSAFGVVPRRVVQGNWQHVYLSAGGNRWHPNPIHTWLRELGIDRQRSWQKVIPAAIFRLPDDQVALFLRHLWATDGCVHAGGAERRLPRIYYATSSPQLASQVQHLLARLGIRSRIKPIHKATYRDNYHVIVTGQEDQVRFADVVGGFGERLAPILAIREWRSGIVGNTNVDTIPLQVWGGVRERMLAIGTTHRAMAARRGTAYGGTSHFKFAPSREVLRSYAEILADAELQAVADADVFWDEIRAIEPDGTADVYDMTVPGTHNFVANGIVVHNSIEQDADVVMFIYREEVYERDTENKGIAEIHVAKHRNGPIGQVSLLWLEKLTKFVDLGVER